MLVRAMRGELGTTQGTVHGLIFPSRRRVNSDLLSQADIDERLPTWVPTAELARRKDAGATGQPELKCPKEIRNVRPASSGKVKPPTQGILAVVMPNAGFEVNPLPRPRGIC